MSDQTSAVRQPNPKPTLKINVGRAAAFHHDGSSLAGTPGTSLSLATTPTPSTKILLKTKPPTPSEVASPLSATTKAGRQTKPTQKIVEANKRELESVEEEAGILSTEAGMLSTGPQSKRIKLKAALPKTPSTQITLRPKRLPFHPPGTGYDSEASDREDDPVIEEQFIIRMMPGDHCEYVRKAIEENRFEARPGGGRQGADILLKFFEEDSRRAVFIVKGQPFAAVMLDLPTIIESMKTWDKKSLMKSADICQMLLVFKMVKNEEEAKHVPLPNPVEGGQRWPHGLTPPMHDCFHRRFAPKMSRKEIMDKEKEVDRLLAADLEAEQSRWEWIDDRRRNVHEEEYSADEQDADGEVDDTGYFPAGEEYGTQEIDEAGLEADLAAAFEADGLDAPTPGTQLEAFTPMTGAAATPAPQRQEDGDESGDADDDEDEDEDEDLDEEEQARLDEIQGVKDIIADLRKQLAQKEAEQQKIVQPLLRQRIEATIRKLKSEIQLKLSSIGQEEED